MVARLVVLLVVRGCAIGCDIYVVGRALYCAIGRVINHAIGYALCCAVDCMIGCASWSCICCAIR